MLKLVIHNMQKLIQALILLPIKQIIPSQSKTADNLRPFPYGQNSGNKTNANATNNMPRRAMRLSTASENANDSKQNYAENATNAGYELLNVGDLVQHNKFGIGEIVQVIGDKGKELYNVNFKDAGKRLLDPRFAKLTKLS